MLLKCILFTALLVAASCATAANTKKGFLKGSSSTHSLTTRQTDWASDGTGDVNYIAKHNIDCQSDKAGAIASFQLKRNENDQIRFEYECSPVSNIDWDTCVDSTSDAVDISSADKTSAQLLVGQTVQCDAYSVLTAFRLKPTTDGSELRYRYTCCRASTGSCSKDVTNTETLVNGNIANLDSQLVAASHGNVLTGFVLRSETSEEGVVTASYRFSYCGAEQDVVRQQTGSSTRGGGDIIYLDRHNIDCKSTNAGAISRFRLQRQGADNINYEYECTNAQSIDWDRCTTKTNGWSEIGDRKKSVQFLDRQNVQCDAGTALTQFKFNTNSPSFNKIRYTYTCCAAVLDDCQTASSSVQDIDQGYLEYLDRQNVKAQTGGVMTGFQLQAQYPRGHMTANYRVNSCLAR